MEGEQTAQIEQQTVENTTTQNTEQNAPVEQQNVDQNGNAPPQVESNAPPQQSTEQNAPVEQTTSENGNAPTNTDQQNAPPQVESIAPTKTDQQNVPPQVESNAPSDTAPVDQDNSTTEKRKIEEVNRVELTNFTVKLLKQMLSKRGLDDKGKKSILIDRLKENVADEELFFLSQEVLEEEEREIESDYSEGSSFEEEGKNGKELDENQLKKLTLAKLKDYAKRRGIDTKGKKEEILNRILQRNN